MPIYIESRGIGFQSNTVIRHEYLVYVPEGQELNYDAWKTIGAFPTSETNFGSGSLLNAEFIDAFFSNQESDDQWLLSDFIAAGTSVEELVANGHGAEAAEARQRELVYSGEDEAAIWQQLSNTASVGNVVS
jgi:hypothetical protein